MASNLVSDSFWLNKNVYADAEKLYYENLANGGVMGMREVNEESIPKTTLAREVARARKRIKSSLECMDKSVNGFGGGGNKSLAALLEKMENVIMNLTKRVEALEKKCGASPECGKCVCSSKSTAPAAARVLAPPSKEKEDEEVDLFGSDSEEESEEAKKLKEKRLAEYEAKKSKKTAVVAKSAIILDIKPWDDETDMKQMEETVRATVMDGLVWGASKLVPVAFNIYKLQISCVVEDDKVSVDHLTETLQESAEDYIQSIDIAAFNKV